MIDRQCLPWTYYTRGWRAHIGTLLRLWNCKIIEIVHKRLYTNLFDIGPLQVFISFYQRAQCLDDSVFVAFSGFHSWADLQWSTSWPGTTTTRSPARKSTSFASSTFSRIRKPHSLSRPFSWDTWVRKYYKNGPFPTSFYLFIFDFLTQLTVNVQFKFCRWLDSYRGPLESEASALPTELQPLPKVIEYLYGELHLN